VVRYAKRIVPSRAEFAEILAVMRSKKSNGKPPANDAADLAEGIAYLGLRQGEANALKWGDIDWQRKQVNITGTKTANSTRIVPLFVHAEALFRRMQQGQRPKLTAPVFVVSSCKTPLATACNLLNLPKLNDHYSLRHLAATMWCEAGVSFKTIGAWLGHSERDGGSLAAKTYTHLRAAFVNDEAARVNAISACWQGIPTSPATSSA
ncbi:MAG: site-specific integrase, partial [Verrucomicrobiota bacterium]